MEKVEKVDYQHWSKEGAEELNQNLHSYYWKESTMR